MRALTLIFGLLGLSFLSLTAQSPAESPEQLSEIFVDAVAKKKFKDLEAIIPGVAQWRDLAPDQTEGLSDEEVEHEINHGNVPNLRHGFHTLVHSAKHNGLQLSELEFNETVVQKYTDKSSDPVGLEVLFFYDHYHDKFHLTAVEVGERWYLLEIRDAEKAFTHVRPVKPEGQAFSLQSVFAKRK